MPLPQSKAGYAIALERKPKPRERILARRAAIKFALGRQNPNACSARPNISDVCTAEPCFLTPQNVETPKARISRRDRRWDPGRGQN